MRTPAAVGLSQFLFENDTDEAYFMLGSNGALPPKAVGRVQGAGRRVRWRRPFHPDRDVVVAGVAEAGHRLGDDGA